MLVADFEVERRDFTVAIGIRLEPGERVAVLGPSGAGKTTLLEALAGLVSLTSGEIRLADRRLSSGSNPGADVPLGRRGVGLLRQNPGLFPHLSVLENICYPLGANSEAACATARRMGLETMLQARPRALSGGEAQRVGLCRTLQTEVQLLCLDEPFSSLDRRLGRELLELLLEELHGRRTTALLVTHQLAEAQSFADRLAILYRGELLQVGDPREVVLRPRSARVASLVGYRGWLRRGEQVMAIHPDRVELSGAADGDELISGTVLGMRPTGARVDVEVDVDAEWVGRFHWSAAEPPLLGANLRFHAAQAPIFSGPEALVG
ncbi:MAG: ABC transporter ATP-binding protein [Candidatus Dormibacteria bacterium]